MNALRMAAGLLSRRFTSPLLADPEPVYAQRRPTVGLFRSLTPEQQQRALNYRGPENHGDPDFTTGASAR
jgi:hypothetical protein